MYGLTNIQHEEAFIKAFVRDPQRRRLLQLIRTPKARRKFLDAFHHSLDLDSRWSSKLPGAVTSAVAIADRLRALGAGNTVYVMSDMMTTDQFEQPLEDALHDAKRAYGVVLSCIPGRLAYYQREEVGERYILSHPSRQTASKLS